MIAEVVFNLPLERSFHYLVPQEWRERLRPGARVLAPFGHRRLVGYVARLLANSPIPRLKPLLKPLDDQPWFTPERRRLAEWLAGYYGCALGEACAAILPAALRVRMPLSTERQSPPQEPPQPLLLTAQQRQALDRLMAALRSGQSKTFLLHGITGSGKTEIYLRLIEEALGRGRSAMMLVPEIALTPQMIDWVRQRFGEQAVLWHSRLSARKRGEAWQRLATGTSRVVLGTRSAVFAPVQRLGLMIVDEEHDPSYKQGESPRYHARDVAIARARMQRAVTVLGSATPSIESAYLARRGRYQLLELTERIPGRQLPRVDIVDMREELGAQRGFPLLSRRLQLAVQRTLDERGQAILLLNRRGFARIAQCPACGGVVQCTRCAVPLVYHAGPRRLLCHYCSFQAVVPETCPACRKGYVRLRGAGTERVESELHRLFPASRIARMDRDTTASRDAPRQLFEALKAHAVELLVGTQLVAKGLDLPAVTLVGVVSADTSLYLPDFRAGERTFDLLTQVAGRAGRGERPGQVLIQTFCPGHYAIDAASRHDYQTFYDAEIRMRRRLRLPPFCHLIDLTVQGHNQERVKAASQALREALCARFSQRQATVLGPAPHRIPRLRRAYRWRVLLKVRAVESAVRVVRDVLGPGRRVQGLPVLIDVDPL